jgi:hypothetical protein
MTAGYVSMPAAAVLGAAAFGLAAAARQSDRLQPWVGVLLAATLLIFTAQYVPTILRNLCKLPCLLSDVGQATFPALPAMPTKWVDH